MNHTVSELAELHFQWWSAPALIWNWTAAQMYGKAEIANCSHLICHLCVPLQKQNSKEQSHKNQKAKKPNVVLPSLGLLTVPAQHAELKLLARQQLR